jgi:ferritin-like metal-binding protein YciE
MSIGTMEDLFLDQLRDLYHAEKQLVKALPKMAKNSNSAELRQAFESHLQQTEEHVSRLEQVFEQVGSRAKAKKCEAMEGLVEEGQEVIDSGAPAEVLDAGLICAAQKVEHYEIAAYGTLITWATQLGHKDCAAILKKTLDEEKAADDKLTNLAESGVNQEAAAANGR